MLTLVKYGSLSTNRITLRHYVNGVHVSDYVLELKIGLRHQQPQSYDLPQLNEGMVEVNVELVNGMHKYNSSFTINYDKASNLYEKGLLIYTTDDYNSNTTIGDFIYYDRYIYFKSGEDETSYFEKAGSSEWSLITDAPQPKRFTRKEMGYSSLYYGWKENKWVVSPTNNKPNN
jgi:hypothetical protein